MNDSAELAMLNPKLVTPALYLFGLGWGGNYTMLQGLVADVFGALGPWATGALFDVTKSYQLGFSVIVVLIAASLAAILFVRLPARAAH